MDAAAQIYWHQFLALYEGRPNLWVTNVDTSCRVGFFADGSCRMCWSPICSAPPTASTHRAGSAVRRVGIWIASCLCRQGAGDQGWISYNCCCLIAAHCLDHLPKRYFWWSKSRLQRTREARPIKPEVAPLLKVAQSGIWFSFWKPFIWFPSWCTIHTSLQDCRRTENSREEW